MKCILLGHVEHCLQIFRVIIMKFVQFTLCTHTIRCNCAYRFVKMPSYVTNIGMDFE